jgi:hypothetical protein
LIWSGLLRVIQRLTRYKRSDKLEFKLNFAVPDLLSDKGKAVKDQVEALVQAVQKAGSYQAREEATRAVHAVMDALKDRVPPDVLLKLSESLPVREAARLRHAAAQRLQKGETGEDETGAPDGVNLRSPDGMSLSESDEGAPGTGGEGSPTL